MGLVRLGISTPSANTNTTLFTADNQYLVSIIATNKSTTTAANLNIWVQPSGATLDSQYAYLVYNFPIDASNTYESFRFAVNQNDVVRVSSSTANVSFSAYGVVQYDVKIGAGISTYSATSPSIPVDGMIWVDSSASIPGSSSKPAYVYNSSSASWVSIATNQYVPYSSTQPSSPKQGDLWVDSTAPTAPILKTYNGTSWIALGASVNDRDLIISQRMFA